MSRQIEIVSASLLVTPSHSSRPDSNFCLGLLDWCPCCIRKSKMCSKSLKLKRPRVSQNVEISTEKAEESNDRYSFETTIEELESYNALKILSKTTSGLYEVLSRGEQQEISSTLRNSVLQIYL